MSMVHVGLVHKFDQRDVGEGGVGLGNYVWGTHVKLKIFTKLKNN